MWADVIGAVLVRQALLDYLRTGAWMEPLELVLQSRHLQIHSGLRHTVVQFYVSVFRTGEIMYLHSAFRFLQSLLSNKRCVGCVAHISAALFMLSHTAGRDSDALYTVCMCRSVCAWPRLLGGCLKNMLIA